MVSSEALLRRVFVRVQVVDLSVDRTGAAFFAHPFGYVRDEVEFEYCWRFPAVQLEPLK